MEIGDREAQTPSSSITKKISGSVSPWPESALAAVRDEVVCTGDRDAQTSPSISAKKTLGDSASNSAALELPLIGQGANAPTANIKTRTNTDRYCFMPLLPKKEVSTPYITKVVCELRGRAA